MLFVTTFRLGEREQDVAFLAAATSSQIAVNRSLGALVREIPSPPSDVLG